MARLTHHEWFARVAGLKERLNAEPDSLDLARQFWAALGDTASFDLRTGQRAIDAFQSCAMKTSEGLGELVSVIRSLADEIGEYPRPELFDPPLENLLRHTARQPDNPISGDAAWILGHIDSEP